MRERRWTIQTFIMAIVATSKLKIGSECFLHFLRI